MFDFLDFSIKHLSNAALGTILASQNIVLDRLGKAYFSKIADFGPHEYKIKS